MDSQEVLATLMAAYDDCDPFNEPCFKKSGPVNMFHVYDHESAVTLMTSPKVTRRFVPRFALPWMNLSLSGPAAMPRGWRHDLLRSLVVDVVSPAALRPVMGYIEAIGRGAVRDAASNGQFDLADVTEEVSYQIICELLGIKGKDRTHARRVQFFRWLDEYGEATPFALPAQKYVKRYYRKFIRERRRQGLDEPVDKLLRDRRLNKLDKMGMLFFIMLSATLTTSYAICSAYILMRTHARFFEWRRDILAGDNRLLGRIYREALRLCGPVRERPVLVKRTIVVAGHKLRPGTLVQWNWPSANRDPRVFSDPLVFDPSRDQKHSLAFSVGDYACPGQQLSSVTAAAVLRALLELPEPPLVTDLKITTGGAYRMNHVILG